MRGVVVKATLVLAILAPALLAEEDPTLLGDVFKLDVDPDPGTKPQRGDIAGDLEVS